MGPAGVWDSSATSRCQTTEGKKAWLHLQTQSESEEEFWWKRQRCNCYKNTTQVTNGASKEYEENSNLKTQKCALGLYLMIQNVDTYCMQTFCKETGISLEDTDLVVS